jgi:5-methylcytosine-specific restriction protein B
MPLVLSERQTRFRNAATQDEIVRDPQQWKPSVLFGVSNSAKVIDGGLLLGVSNLEKFAESPAVGALFCCVIKFPPEDEVYFTVYVHSDLAAFKKQLSVMPTKGATRNNNVRLYLASDGKMYLRNEGYLDSVVPGEGDFNPPDTDPPIEIDKITYAVYPPAASAKRSLLAQEFVGYLARLVGRERVYEVNPWGEDHTIGPLMRRMPHTFAVNELEDSVRGLGGHYVDDLVRRYHIGLNYLERKHFVILTGLSGTGKTGLFIRYAQAVHGITDTGQSDPLLFLCPVRPDWTDPAGLTGYYDVISNRYIVPPFLEAVLLATAYRESPVFVCLDEMNLARVEYYFSDVLSAMESGLPLQLHSSAVSIEGSTGGEIPSSLALPPNLYITGTVNIDETTHPFSDKVLDRAVVIDMSRVDLEGFFNFLINRHPDLQGAVADSSVLLTRVNKILSPHGLGFGYRVTEEFVRYYKFAVQTSVQGRNDIFDHLMLQKVLVRLRGTEKQREMLRDLGRILSSFPKSIAVIERLTAELDELNSFQNTH